MAFNGYCGVHFRKLKTAAHIKKACSHDRRGHTPQNVNPDRMSQNLALLDHGMDRWGVINDQISKRVKRKVRNNAVRMIEAFIYSSPEYFRPNDPDKKGTWDEDRLQPWVKKVQDWLLREFCKDNVLEIHLHLDEATPHIHAVLLPITNDGRLTAKEWLMNRTGLRNAQSSLANALQPLGLTRGLKGSGAKHIPADKWAAEIQKCLNTRARAPKPEPAGKLPVVSADKYKTLEKDYRSVVSALRKAEKRAAHIQTIEAENLQLKKTNSAYAANSKQLKQSIINYEKELERLRPLAQKVRGISLQQVLDDHPLGGLCFVNDQDKVMSRSTGEPVDGRNAIDLVMYLGNWDYKQAVYWLCEMYGHEDTTTTLLERERPQATTKINEIVRDVQLKIKEYDTDWRTRTKAQRQYFILYQHNIDEELIEDCNLWENQNGRFLKNTARGYHIWDKGDRLILKNADNIDLRKAVTLMLEIAADKGWDLKECVRYSTGSQEFLDEVRRQVHVRLLKPLADEIRPSRPKGP